MNGCLIPRNNGRFDRNTLQFEPDRPEWSGPAAGGDDSAARHFAYDYGVGRYPKTYLASDGRRIYYAWITGDPHEYPAKRWTGLQTVPRVLTAARDGDSTTAILSKPAVELEALRKMPPRIRRAGIRLGHAATRLEPGVRHYDLVVTFRGLKD